VNHFTVPKVCRLLARLSFPFDLTHLSILKYKHQAAAERWGLSKGSAGMANEEHVALLKQGVHGWNIWRKENPHVPVPT
jgi:hypothetical protein